MSRDVRHMLIFLALLFGVPLIAWGGCLLSDPLFGNDPMVFYGHVVDAEGQPKSGVRVEAMIRRHRRIPNLSMGWDPSFMQEVEKEAVTDEEGRFEIRGRGHRLSIRKIDGLDLYYWETRAAGSYHFPWRDYPPGEYARPDDPADPVKFKPHTERRNIKAKQR